VTFTRLTRGHLVALIAALALLPVMALDWYGTDAGDEARQIEKDANTSGSTSGEIPRKVKEDARIVAENSEQTAWQADAFADRLILFAVLAALALAIAAAWLRAANVKFKPPLTPSAIAAIVGLVAIMLLSARVIQKPDADPGTNVKVGAPVALVLLGALTLGSRAAWSAERERSAGAAPPPVFDHERA
jgi:hypothetical protein